MYDINSKNWHDYYFEKLEMDFDDILIRVADESEAILTIKCERHIGISYLGHWDESVIQSIKISSAGELTAKALEIVKSNYTNCLGGGYRKIETKWVKLILTLIDGNSLTVVCEKAYIV